MTKTITYFFSLNSPWSYLGDTRLSEIAERHNTKIAYKPTDFTRVFPKTGGIPVSKRAPARRAYRLQELERWRIFLDIPLIITPKNWPSNERLAVGMIISAINEELNVSPLVNAFFRALWAQDRDIGDDKTLIAIAEETGFSGADLLVSGRKDITELQWKQNGEDALDFGVFGAPSYLFGEQLFWGQDRLEFLDRALAST